MIKGKRGRPKKSKEPEIFEPSPPQKQERRGRPKEPEYVPPPRKYKKVYEDENTTETWTYDRDIFPNGPISVEIKYKNGYDLPKNWNKMQRDAKNERRTNRQMRKINSKPPPPKKKSKLKSKR